MDNIKKVAFGLTPVLQFGSIVKEQFGDSSGAKDESNPVNSLIGMVVTIIALYLAIKCKKNGNIDIMQILLAICCSPCYIAYRLAVPCA
jgi:hypothetical protein